MLLVMLTWLAAMWWIRWGIATLPDELGAPPDPPPAPPPPPPLLAGEGLSERGDGVPLTLQKREQSNKGVYTEGLLGTLITTTRKMGVNIHSVRSDEISGGIKAQRHGWWKENKTSGCGQMKTLLPHLVVGTLVQNNTVTHVHSCTGWRRSMVVMVKSQK